MGADDGSNGGSSGEVEDGRMNNSVDYSENENSVGNIYTSDSDTSLLGEVFSPSATEENGYGPDDFRGKGSGDDDTSSNGASCSSPSKCATETTETLITIEPGEVLLRCIFANHDGVMVKMAVPLSCPILSIKEALLTSWPEGRYTCHPALCFLGTRRKGTPPLELRTHTQCNLNSDVGMVETPSQMRLISFGHILYEDSTLESCNLPSFGRYVPVNVSLRPKSQHLLRGELEV